MRADRLLAMLMLLQTRGRTTAQTLAVELEVSERTIYRDIDALSMAGVPVFAERGPGGGIELLEGYRTTLTGLTPNEVQALFMLSVPSSLEALGVSPALKSAMRKLAAALPTIRLPDEIHTRQRILLDATPWQKSQPNAVHLQLIQQAVWEDRLLAITVELFYETRIQSVVAPYGLVAKAEKWHLVWEQNGRIDTYPIANIRSARILDETFARPADFDLELFWRNYCTAVANNQPQYIVIARFSPQIIPHLPDLFSQELSINNPQAAPDTNGNLILTLNFTSFEEARTKFLSLGKAVQVLSPQPLKLAIADYARQILATYSNN